MTPAALLAVVGLMVCAAIALSVNAHFIDPSTNALIAALKDHELVFRARAYECGGLDERARTNPHAYDGINDLKEPCEEDRKNAETITGKK